MNRMIEGLKSFEGEMLEYSNFFREDKIRGKILSIRTSSELITVKIENVFKFKENKEETDPSKNWVSLSLEDKEINIEHQFYIHSFLSKENKELLFHSSLHGKEFKFYRQ